MRMAAPRSFLLLVVTGPAVCRATVVTISNVAPRLDAASGLQLELGEGSLAKFGERFYLYGTQYRCMPTPVSHEGGACNRTANLTAVWARTTYGVASSTDLVTWRTESHDILPEMHGGPFPNSNFSYTMPSITYSPESGVYALWFQVEHAARGVATSTSPTGPFKVVHWCVPGLQLGSDFFFWRGSDGATYMKHNGGCAPLEKRCPGKTGGGICVKKLAPNLTDIVETAESAVVPAGEGGGFFERDGRWYIMHGHGCCACSNGDNAETWESIDGPFGPYRKFGEASPCAGIYPNRTCALGAQQFGVAEVPRSDGGTNFLYIGLRYGSSPDGLQCHVPQYWAPLQFDGAGHVEPLAFQKEFELDVAVGRSASYTPP